MDTSNHDAERQEADRLAHRLLDHRPHARSAAGLGLLMIDPSVAVPAVVRVLDAGDITDRGSLPNRVLAQVGSRAVEPIMELLSNGTLHERRRAPRALRAIEPHAHEALDVVLDRLRDQDEDGIVVLGLLGVARVLGPEYADRTLPVLIERLEDPRFVIVVIGIIGGLGRAGRPAVEQLEVLAKVGDKPVRERALDAIAMIEGGPSLLLGSDRSMPSRTRLARPGHTEMTRIGTVSRQRSASADAVLALRSRRRSQQGSR